MRCGYFDDRLGEYVITDPVTPVKWINYVGTLTFGGYVDHTGGALLCRGDPTENRITKYIPQMPAGEFKATTLYVRLRRQGRQIIFSPFFVPTLGRLESFACHVGLGHNRWEVEAHGLAVEVCVFVPLGDLPVELRTVTVVNSGRTPCEVDLVPVVEFSHPQAVMQLTNADWVPQTMQARLAESHGYRFLVQYPFMLRDTRVNFFGASRSFSSFETDRRVFLGNNEYSTWARPGALARDELSCTQANRGDVIGALMLRLGTLERSEKRQAVIMLGQESTVEAAGAIVARFSRPGEAQRAHKELIANWNEYLDAVRVQTPDPEFDRMVNIHNPRQCRVTVQWSRYLSTYQLGLGTRGIGIRDRSQDLMGVVSHEPAIVRGMLLELLAMQRPDGSAVHQFNPLTHECSSGDAADRPDRPQYYSDDHLWMALAVCVYMQETADRDFLGESVPFRGSGETGVTVLDHLRRALAFTRTDRGRHGLPLLGFADWNDTVNLPPGAESLFSACLYGAALQRTAALCRWLGLDDEAGRYDAYWQEMCDAVNAHCWDGHWYVRYFDQNGVALGSHAQVHGSIYLNAQTWPVIAGFAPPERAAIALESAHRMLNTAYGLKLIAPAYNRFDPETGGITTYPPGAKENGGIFVHTNPWAIIASALLGDGQRAFQYFRQVNPAARNETIERFECEPYVYPQNVLGDEHPQHGLARNSWLTGAASWMYQAALGWILGVRADFDGLVVDPCVPQSWRSFSVRRRFRGCRYRIDVRNPDGVCHGVREMTVDGGCVPGTIIPAFADGREHRVTVVMGDGGPARENPAARFGH